MIGNDVADSKTWQELQEEAVVEKKRIKPLTRNQEKYFRAIETSTITLCYGPAGTGKTYIPCGIAAGMLQDGRIERIILTRPLVSCGRGYGFRPGDVFEKILPVMRPMIEALEEFFTKKELLKLIKEEVVELWPLDDMRGASIKNAVLICDEAQNAEYAQLHMLLTRFGKGTRVIVSGDITQTDLSHSGENPFKKVCERLRGSSAISHVELSRRDIVRHPLIQWVDERLSGTVIHDDQDQEDNEAWYDCNCPKCGELMWYSNGDENNLSEPDVDQAKCWKCGTVVDVPRYDGDEAKVSADQDNALAATSFPEEP